MGVMLDEYERITGKSQPAMITGKPLALGGSLGRDTATADGAIAVLKCLMQDRGLDATTLAASVQGAGNAGAHAARLLYGMGMKIIAIADSEGTLFREEGLDAEKVLALKETGKHVHEASEFMRGSSAAPPGAAIEADCDVLVPAALEEQITSENISEIKAGIVLEVANGPVTPEADKVLAARGVAVIPDVLANAGGVTVSYFEWIQNRTGERWEAQMVKEKLESTMGKAYRSVADFSIERGITLREASYALAVERIIGAQRARGL